MGHWRRPDGSAVFCGSQGHTGYQHTRRAGIPGRKKGTSVAPCRSAAMATPLRHAPLRPFARAARKGRAQLPAPRALHTLGALGRGGSPRLIIRTITFECIHKALFIVGWSPWETAIAWSRSARMSSICSMPIDIRIRSGLTPAAICCSGLN